MAHFALIQGSWAHNLWLHFGVEHPFATFDVHQGEAQPFHRHQLGAPCLVRIRRGAGEAGRMTIDIESALSHGKDGWEAEFNT